MIGAAEVRASTPLSGADSNFCSSTRSVCPQYVLARYEMSGRVATVRFFTPLVAAGPISWRAYNDDPLDLSVAHLAEHYHGWPGGAHYVRTVDAAFWETGFLVMPQPLAGATGDCRRVSLPALLPPPIGSVPIFISRFSTLPNPDTIACRRLRFLPSGAVD